MTNRRSATKKILKSTSSFVAMLTAGVIMSPATSFAIDAGALPENGTVVGGSASLDYGTPNKLDVHQNTDRVVIDWDSFNIGTDATTQFYQPGSNSLAVNRVYSKGADPTQILGKLIANGRVMVLDRNGVIFGKDAVVDVGGIIASTGDINVDQVMSGANKIDLSNFGSGSIVNNGLINASESGIVALVGPNAANNGVINAKLGKVTLAAGEKATVDLYGDGLIEIAANSNLEKAIVSNTGTINAEGGTVQLTAQAAKDAVDNVINMDGVVDVSSVSVQGGKIVLSGNGTTNVTGKLKSSNGKIEIKSKNINVADTAQISNNGDNATVDIIAEKHTDFRGAIQAVGGDVEVSGKETLGFTGLVQADTLLLDPEWAIIHSGALNNPLGLGYVLSAQALANSMELGTTVTVQADDFIDIGVRSGGYSTGNPILDILINAAVGTLGAGDIDLSKYNYTTTSFVPFFPFIKFTNHNGTTQGSIRFTSDTVNLNKNLIMGNGGAIVNAETLNLNAKIYDKDKTTLLGDSRLTGTGAVETINVGANGVVQQGINFADDDAALTTVNITGTHKENITIAKNNIKLAGALGAKLEAANATSLVKVTGDNVNIDPIVFDGLGIALNGIDAVGADNLVVDGNTFLNFTGVGIRVQDSNNVTINNNTVYNTGSHGIYLLRSENSTVSNNDVGTLGLAGNIKGDGIFGERAYFADIFGNTVQNTAATNADNGNGIRLKLSADSIIDDNDISNTGAAGIMVDSSSRSEVTNNTTNETSGAGIYTRFTPTILVDNNTVRHAGGVGIMFLNNSGGVLTITNNTVNKSGDDAIRVQVADNAIVANNTIGYGDDGILGTADDADSRSRDGIRIEKSNGTSVTGNKVANTRRHGIYSSYSDNVTIGSNIVDITGNAGIYLLESTNTDILSNLIGTSGIANNINGDGVLVQDSAGALVSGNTIEETTQTAIDVGSGVHILNSGNSTVSGNTISDAEWDGVKITGGSGISVLNNDIDDVTRVGVYAKEGTGILVQNNDIDGSGLDGIRMLQMTGNSRVLSNTIDNTGDHGISADNSAGILIESNLIGTEGGSAIGDSGIYVEDSASSTVRSNIVSNTGKHGVQLLRAANALVTANTINDTGANGIHVVSGANGTITNNLIGTLGGNNNINGDGIYVEKSNGASISGNTIDETTNTAFDIGSGVHVKNSSNVTVSGNTVTDAEWDGVKLTNGNNIDVLNNVLTNLDRVGVYTLGTSNATITNNTITNADLYGIRILDAAGVTLVNDNTIDDVVIDGINVNNAADIRIENNQIGQTTGVGNDGINVANSLLASIVDNLVSNAARAGVYLGLGTGTGTVANNTVSDSDIGMYFESGLIDLTGTANTLNGGRVGYHFEPLVGNSVNLVGDTIGSTIFNGQSQYYVELANGALYNPGTPTVIDGTLASYDGFIPNSVGNILTQAQYDDLESRIFHWNDDNTLGLFFFGSVPEIDQSLLFRDINGVPGVAGRFSITIRGLPRIAGVTAPAFTTGAGGSASISLANNASALNQIETAAGDDEQPGAQQVSDIEPAAGTSADVIQANSWNAAIDAASKGQVVSYSFSGDGSDALRGL